MRYARETFGLTQAQVADALGPYTPAIIDEIENNGRGISGVDLTALANLLERDIAFFFDPLDATAEAAYGWQSMADVDADDVDRAIRTVNGIVGLQRFLLEGGAVDVGPLKWMLRLNRTSSTWRAQECAQQMGEMLDLGVVPADRLMNAIDLDSRFALPTVFVDLGEKAPPAIAGGTVAHFEDLDILLIARNRSAPERIHDIARAFFGALTWGAGCTQELAVAFADALLMPLGSISQLVASDKRQDAVALCNVAQALGVTPAALARRLYELRRIDEPTRDELANLVAADDSNVSMKLLSRRYQLLLHSALADGALSARKAASALGMTLKELAALFDSYGPRPPFNL
ncbi:MAG: DNA-binding protein [Rhizobacter sp.]|nr:DNA-binding protein [Rhizobacter sp.]